MELNTILEENDFTLVVDYTQVTGNSLSRTELEDIVFYAIGQSVPDNNVRFIVTTLDDKYFLVLYLKDKDKFLYEKLTAR